MPEIHFRVRWPDGRVQRCYSPSSTTRDFFEVGRGYPLKEFLDRSRSALIHASERVRQRYGYACSSASAQLDDIERNAAMYAALAEATVVIEGFES